VIDSYRLETIAAHLIELLEGRRRAYTERPDALEGAAARVADETLDAIEREYSEVMGGDLALVRREIHESFLPRYNALARDHNELEQAGYHAWRRGDPAARVAGFVIALILASVFTRLVHSPVAVAGYAAALAVPFVPDLRAMYYRRKYQAELQSLVDDMGRIQKQLGVYSE